VREDKREPPWGFFGVLARADNGRVGAWLDKNDAPDWQRLSGVGYSVGGELHAELRSNTDAEAEEFAAVCRAEGFEVTLVPRTYMSQPDGKTFQRTAVVFSRGKR
jgi:hypothetical protein